MGILFVKANFCFAENFKLSFPQQVVSLSPVLLSTISSLRRKHFRAIVRMRRPLCQDCQVIRGGGSGSHLTGFITFQTCCCRYKKDAGTQWIHSPSGQVYRDCYRYLQFLFPWLQLVTTHNLISQSWQKGHRSLSVRMSLVRNIEKLLNLLITRWYWMPQFIIAQ